MTARQIASMYLKARDWRFETDVPKEKKYVIVAYPHTSYWDGFNLLMCAHSVNVRLRWMVKSSLVEGPMGPLLLALGAVPIDRSKANNMVDQMVAEFARQDEFVLTVPPEGTRSKRDYWKSGFYHIARKANVPVVPGYLDFERRTAGLGEPIHLSGEMSADMDRVRSFYRALAPQGRHQERVGQIRLRAEDETAVDDVSIARAGLVP